MVYFAVQRLGEGRGEAGARQSVDVEMRGGLMGDRTEEIFPPVIRCGPRTLMFLILPPD